MKLNLNDTQQVEDFIDSVRVTDPEIEELCREVISEMIGVETSVPVTRIKRLARKRVPDYEVAMSRAVAVAETILMAPSDCEVIPEDPAS